MTYALDTNTVSYFIQGNERVKTRMRSALEEGHNIIIPPITYYEIRRGFKHKSAPAKEKAFTSMCLTCPVGEMTVSTWEHAAEIYGNSHRMGNPINDADILIAAFCVVGGYTLVTNNTKHFKDIDGLQFVNWAE